MDRRKRKMTREEHEVYEIACPAMLVGALGAAACALKSMDAHDVTWFVQYMADQPEAVAVMQQAAKFIQAYEQFSGGIMLGGADVAGRA